MVPLIIMQNIDAMHQESNVAETLIHTCMHFEKKTENNPKARRDVVEIYDDQHKF
jgi:hypothetical protein